ncbi:MAG: penicillin acylase family protein, partial [Planctomycetota bacterium]
RDNWGVPTCIGDTTAACLFAFGVAQAEDHWREMLVNYFMAEGTMAEHFGDLRSPLAVSVERESGPMAAAMLTNKVADQLAQQFNLPGIAAERHQRLPADLVRLMDAFAAGVNWQLNELGGIRPTWARDVTSLDITRLGTFVSFSRTLEFISSEPRGMPQEGRGSNQWVIAPALSSTGHVMFHMDPHLDYTGLSQWYEAQLVCPEFHMRGATFFGMPLLVMGFTDELVWSMTRNRPDVVDIYREKVNPANPAEYWNPDAPGGGAFVPFGLRQVAINVLQPDGSLKAEPLTIATTRHGPVLPPMLSMTAGKGGVYAARSSLLECEKPERGGFVGQLLQMARAKDMTQFRKAVGLQQIPLWNIMAGSVQGDIWYVFNCWCPKRPHLEGGPDGAPAFDYTRPLPGDTNEAEWQGFFAFDELPQILNPASGWMMNCNCNPNHVTDGDLPISAPTYLCPVRETTRSVRATELLRNAAAHAPIHPDTFLAFGQDCLVEDARQLVPRISNGALGLDLSSDELDAVMHLAEWDGQARASSVPACHFLTWLRFARGRLETELTSDAKLAAHFVAHLREFPTRFGNGQLNVPWGELHGIHRGKQWFGLSGATELHETIRAGRSPGPRQDCLFGSSFTQTVVFGADGKPRAWSVVPFGASEQRLSPHYDDQLRELYSQDRYKDAWFTHADVCLHAESFVTGRELAFVGHPDAPPLRIFPPYVDEDDADPPVSICRARVRWVDLAPMHWQPSREHGTVEIVVENRESSILVPAMQPGQLGRPLYAMEEWYGPEWRAANGNRIRFNPGLLTRGLWGLFRKRPLDAEEGF